MKKVNILFVLSFVVSIFLSATAFGNGNGSSASSPSDVVIEFYDCVKSGDYEGLVKFMKGSDNYTDEVKNQFVNSFEKNYEAQKKSNGGIDEVTIIEENINETGDVATVKINVVFEDGSKKEDEMRLSKENGKWKIG